MKECEGEGKVCGKQDRKRKSIVVVVVVGSNQIDRIASKYIQAYLPCPLVLDYDD